MTLDGRRWWSIKQTADMLGIHVQTAYQLFYRGELPGARVGRSVRIDSKKVLDQMEAQMRSADRARR